jgi:hypothetical protein
MTDIIRNLIESKFNLFNVDLSKCPVDRKGKRMKDWINKNYDELVKEHNYKSELWGINLGVQTNGRCIMSLDFDIYDKTTDGIDEHTNNLKQYYLEMCKNENGIYTSSTEGNINVLVDYTNSSTIKNYVNKLNSTKFKKYELEILVRGNQVIPPSKTTCKKTNKLGNPRKFKVPEHQFYIIEEENCFTFNFIKDLFEEKLNESKTDRLYINKELLSDIETNEGYEENTIILESIENIEEDKTINLYNDEMSVMSDITENGNNDKINNINKILSDSNKELAITYIFDELLVHNVFTTYKNWLDLCFCIYNEYNGNNDGYKLLIKLCSKLSNFDENECFEQYNKKTKKIINKDKQVRLGTLRHKYFDYYPENRQKKELNENIRIDYTERGMANLFIKLKGECIVYQEDSLYIYYNNEWIYEKKGDLCKYVIGNILINHICNEIQKLNIRYKSYDVTEEEKEEIKKRQRDMKKFIDRLKTIKFIGEILKQIQSILSGKLTKIVFDLGEEQKNNIHFKNGVYDLKKKEFRQRRYDDYVTKILDYNYIEKDKIEKEIHDFVEEFYKKIQPIESERKFMLGYLAYCLTGNVGKQIFKINIGYTASNGKSTEMSIHDKVFPIYTKKLNKSTFNKGNAKFHKFVIVCLYNPIRLCYLEELDESLIDADILKDWIDGRKISIEILFGTEETKSIQAKLMTCSNKDINIKGDEGLYRRGRLQFYNSIFEDRPDDDYMNNRYKKIENLDEYFNDEKYKNAYFHLLLNYIDDLEIPSSSKQNLKNLVDENDDLKSDIYDNFEITKNSNDKLSKRFVEEILEKYKWTNILTKLKSMGVVYDRDRMYNGEKSILSGIKMNNNIFIEKVTNEIITNIIYNI